MVRITCLWLLRVPAVRCELLIMSFFFSEGCAAAVKRILGKIDGKFCWWLFDDTSIDKRRNDFLICLLSLIRVWNRRQGN
jgi:hypothetical protein